MVRGMITEHRRCPGGCRMARDLGKSSSGGSAARLFPGSRRVVAARSLSRLWHGELPLRGVFPGSGTESCRCAESFPALARRVVAARSVVRTYDGQHSVLREVSEVTTEKAPRSCRKRRRTLRDHAPARERSAVMPQNGSTPRSRARQSDNTAGTEPGPLRKNRTASPWETRPRGPGRNEAGAREATCLIMSHATVSLTWVIFRSHGLDHDHGIQCGSRRLPLGS